MFVRYMLTSISIALLALVSSFKANSPQKNGKLRTKRFIRPFDRYRWEQSNGFVSYKQHENIVIIIIIIISACFIIWPPFSLNM